MDKIEIIERKVDYVDPLQQELENQDQTNVNKELHPLKSFKSITKNKISFLRLMHISKYTK